MATTMRNVSAASGFVASASGAFLFLGAFLLLGASLLLGAVPAAFGVVRTVYPDGSGEYPTIQAAVDASVDGDVIELAPGTFTGAGNRDVEVPARSLTIRSQSGDPDACVVDCEHAGRAFSFVARAAGQALEGITITGGLTTEGGGGALRLNSGVTVSDCVFQGNHTEYGGGAVVVDEVAPVFLRCRFLDNSAQYAGGALAGGGTAPQQTSPVFEDCQFVGNVAADFGGGAVFLEAVALRDATFRGCTFARNSAQRGGALLLYGFSPLLESCTFVHNAASGGGGVVECVFSGYWPASPTITNTILAFSTVGAAVTCSAGSQPTLLCSDVYGNAGGDWVGCIQDQAGEEGNISEDPLFCGDEEDDYTIASGSPCAPQHDPDCGLIGAWPVGCDGPVPVVVTSWGRIKRGYGR
ncbi:MAG: hypothetical protein ACE15D_10660 [Candidatus Eisenbacteria bacterium]